MSARQFVPGTAAHTSMVMDTLDLEFVEAAHYDRQQMVEAQVPASVIEHVIPANLHFHLYGTDPATTDSPEQECAITTRYRTEKVALSTLALVHAKGDTQAYIKACSV